MRVGIGYDIHALKKGRKLVLGGVIIPYSKGLVGHSDGDALTHAVVDAALGALGLGDIGDHFPSSDSRYRGVSSLLFVARVTQHLKRKRLQIAHIDSVVIAEAPPLSRFKEPMKKSLADAFGIPASAVNVKAKSNDGFGSIGQSDAIACYAVVSLKKISKNRGGS